MKKPSKDTRLNAHGWHGWEPVDPPKVARWGKPLLARVCGWSIQATTYRLIVDSDRSNCMLIASKGPLFGFTASAVTSDFLRTMQCCTSLGHGRNLLKICPSSGDSEREESMKGRGR